LTTETVALSTARILSGWETRAHSYKLQLQDAPADGQVVYTALELIDSSSLNRRSEVTGSDLE